MDRIAYEEFERGMKAKIEASGMPWQAFLDMGGTILRCDEPCYEGCEGWRLGFDMKRLMAAVRAGLL